MLQSTSKKPRLSTTRQTAKAKAKGREKEHAYDKPFIPIPSKGPDSDTEISENELEFLAEDVQLANGFLTNLDEKGIARCVL